MPTVTSGSLWTKEELERDQTNGTLLAPSKNPTSGPLWGADDEAVTTPNVVNAATDNTELALSPLEQKFKDITGVRQSTPEEKQNRQYVLRNVATPLLGTAGAAIGLASPVPGGAYIGAGLGTAIGEQFGQLEGERTGVEQPKTLLGKTAQATFDTTLGGIAEYTGAKVLTPAVTALTKLAGKAYRAVSPFTKDVTKRAAGMYQQLTKGAPIVSEVTESGKALEKEIPGLNLSRGELTQDFSTQKLERGAGDEVAAIQHKYNQNNLKAISDYIEKAKGAGKLEDAVTTLEDKGIAVDKKLLDAIDNLEQNKNKFNPVIDVELSGKTVQSAAEKMEKEAMTKYGAAFTKDRTPVIDITNPVYKAREIREDGSKLKANVPELIEKFNKAYGKPNKDGFFDKISPKEIQSLRQEFGEAIRKEQRGEGNLTKIRHLTSFSKELDSAFDAADPILSKEIKEAKAMYKTEVIDKFRKGTIGDIMEYSSDNLRTHPAEVLSKFFKQGEKGVAPVQDFNRAFQGDENLKAELVDYIDNVMVIESTDNTLKEITTKKLETFTNKYKYALKELGITDRYASVDSAAKLVADSRTKVAEFQKSAAAKVLGTDLNKVVEKVFTSGNKGAVTKELMTSIGEDEAAKVGLQNAIVDHITNKANANPTKVGALIKDFEPVYKEIFSGAEGETKLAALTQYQAALSRLNTSQTAKFFAGDLVAQKNFMTDFIKGDRVTHNKPIAVLSGIRALAQSYSNKQAAKFLQRAAIDPEYALTLKLMGSSGESELKSRVAEQMAGLVTREVSRKSSELLRGTP